MTTGAILSGGQGSRMGADKGLTRLAGIPLVRRVADVLSVLVDDMVVSVAPGASRAYSSVLSKGVTVIEDPEPGLGPLQGVVTAMSAAKDGAVLVVPCDVPFLRRSICSLVLSSLEEKDGAVPQVGPYFEPLHGCYNRRCLSTFKKTLDAGDRRLVDAFKHLDIVPVPEDNLRRLDRELQSFWSLNSLQDLAEARRILARR